MKKILHITPHMGGGVGKVMSNAYVCNNYIHSIIVLEEPENYQFINNAKQNGIKVLIKPDNKTIHKLLDNFDIVQIEWWDQPIMCKFLYDLPEIPIRLIMWSHVSGCSYPYIKKDFLENCNRFLFTSPYSMENKYLKDMDDIIKNKTDVVYSSGGFDNIKGRQSYNRKTFNIGYMGTLNFCKLNIDFVNYCAQVNIKDSRFVMIGDASTKEQILEKAREKQIADKFDFLGYVDNVQEQLNKIDVFGYPLNPDHYGTTENALLEAMASGIPPVVLNQCTEKYLIKNMKTGIVVNNKKEYGEAIRYLYINSDKRMELGANAKNHVMQNLSLKNTIKNLERNYDVVMKEKKSIFSFKSILGNTPTDWFLKCLGEEESVFRDNIKFLKSNDTKNLYINNKRILNCKPIFKERNKSSIYHFQRYFPQDKNLTYWKRVLDNSIK